MESPLKSKKIKPIFSSVGRGEEKRSQKVRKRVRVIYFSENGQGYPFGYKGADLERLMDFLKKAQVQSGYQLFRLHTLATKIYMFVQAIMINMVQIHSSH